MKSCSLVFRSLWRRLRKELRLLGEIIAPRRCCVCGVQIDEGCFCSVCRCSFLLRRKLTPEHSGTEFAGELAVYDNLQDGFLDEQIFLYKYEGELQMLLRQLKFQQDAALLPLLTEEARLALPEQAAARLLQGYDDIAFIPTSGERLQQRGFDVPVELFAFLRASGKVRPDLLQRRRRTMSLYALDPAARRQELGGCFAVSREYRHRLQGRRVLLCDDIYTTGSTMTEAASVLRRGGAAKVGCLAFTAAKDNWGQEADDGF